MAPFHPTINPKTHIPNITPPPPPQPRGTVHWYHGASCPPPSDVANRFASYVQIPTNFPQDLAKIPGYTRWDSEPSPPKCLGYIPTRKKTLGIYSVAARDIAWDLSGGRLGYRLGFIRWQLGKSLGIYPGAARDPPHGFLPTCLTQSVGVFRKVRSDPTHRTPHQMHFPMCPTHHHSFV